MREASQTWRRFRAPSPEQRGMALLGVAIAMVLLISVWVIASQGQILHVQRLQADYGKLQAIYAAEAGVYARLDAKADLEAVLEETSSSRIRFEAAQRAYPDGTWIESTGSVTVGGSAYQATARAQVLLGKILKWDLRGS